MGYGKRKFGNGQWKIRHFLISVFNGTEGRVGRMRPHNLQLQGPPSPLPDTAFDRLTRQLLPHRFSEIQAERAASPDSDSDQHPQELEHAEVHRTRGVWIENEAVSVCSRLVPSVRRHNQQREGAILKLITHLGDGFRVATATIVHALTNEFDLPDPMR